MRPSRPESLRGTFVGALAAFLTVALFAPGTARASCSHYVRLKLAELDGGSHGLELLNLPGVAAGAASTAPAPAPGERPRPCSGAFCSGSPGLPDQPVNPAPTGGDDWGLLCETLPAPGVPPVLHLLDDDAPRPRHEGAGVFHPPRRVSRV